MNEIIRVKNASYERYEELLMRRDGLKKEAFQYERAYIREFGEMILEVFKLKLECIRKKKTIEYCQTEKNHGRNVDWSELQEYINNELEEFQSQLELMIEDNEAARNTGQLTETELMQIKKIYRKLVKQIHPDINPMVEKNEKLQELWQRISAAYNCNDLKLMQETEILICRALEQLGNETIDIEIPDIEEKIDKLETEITDIRETEPYIFKFLFGDSELVFEKKDSLNEEKKEYEEYSKQLDEILKPFLDSGVRFTWRMS